MPARGGRGAGPAVPLTVPGHACSPPVPPAPCPPPPHPGAAPRTDVAAARGQQGRQSRAPPGDRVRPRRHRCWPPAASSSSAPGQGQRRPLCAPARPHAAAPREPSSVPAPAGCRCASVPPTLGRSPGPRQAGAVPHSPRTPPRAATHSRPPLPSLRFHGERGGGRVTAAVQREPHAPPPQRAGVGSRTDPTAQERPARPSSRQRESPAARVM